MGTFAVGGGGGRDHGSSGELISSCAFLLLPAPTFDEGLCYFLHLVIIW